MVGVDATLEEIENILLNDQWGSVYAFLVNEGGETIFHPLLRPSSEVRKSLPVPEPSRRKFNIQILLTKKTQLPNHSKRTQRNRPINARLGFTVRLTG